MDPSHPLLVAVQPLVSRIGATVITPAGLRDGDVPLEWDGLLLVGIRLPERFSPAPDTDAGGGLDGIIEDIERSFGGPLTELSRERKQQAVRMFEESGAFSYRKSVEAVAAALGVSRFTVYNYLNRDRE